MPRNYTSFFCFPKNENKLILSKRWEEFLNLQVLFLNFLLLKNEESDGLKNSRLYLINGYLIRIMTSNFQFLMVFRKIMFNLWFGDLKKKLTLSGIAFENAARRLVGKKDYLNYTTYIDYYDEFCCDICDNDGLNGQRFKCIKCFEIDICRDCYYSNNIKLCPTCKSDKLFKYAKDHIYPRASKVII
jgi:hypothetical protein